jgi:hypothetical protein
VHLVHVADRNYEAPQFILTSLFCVMLQSVL